VFIIHNLNAHNNSILCIIINNPKPNPNLIMLLINITQYIIKQKVNKT